MNPFQLAWDLLKANPIKTRQTRFYPDINTDAPHPRVSMIARKLADQREKARAHLQQNPPHLRRVQLNDGMTYHMMAGNKKIGQVGVGRNTFDSMPHIEGEADKYDIGSGEVNRPYQRQGLYGRALQGIINDVGSLSSTGRNSESGPFHEQFNPPNVDMRRLHREYDNDFFQGRLDLRDPIINYTQRPPKETPRDWGALQYDTGAMPVLDDKGPLQPPALNPINREQTSLGQWGYVPGYPRYN